MTEGPIHILSDLHLAHPGSRITEVAQLRPLLEGARTVLFNGDTFELRKKALVPRALECRAELEAMCAELGAEPVFMTGNHDPQITDHHYFDLCGGEVFLTHGDILYEDVSPWSKLIVDMHRVLDEIRAEYPPDYLDDLDLRLKAAKRIAAETKIRAAPKAGALAKFKTIAMEMWPPKRPLAILKAWCEAHRLAHGIRDQFRPEARFIITGHTHRAGINETGGKISINTGAFLPMAKSLTIRIDGGSLIARDIVERDGAFCPGRERGKWDVGASVSA